MVNKDAISNLMNVLNTFEEFSKTFPDQIKDLKQNEDLKKANNKMVSPEFLAKINEARSKIYSI